MHSSCQIKAKHASEVKKISVGVIYNYLVRTLSVALVRGVASAINNKTFSVTSHNANLRSDPSGVMMLLLNQVGYAKVLTKCIVRIL